MNNEESNSEERTEKVTAATVLGVAFIVVLILLAIYFPDPTQFQYEIFRVVLALAAAGFAAILPGAISTKLPWGIGAVGSLAVFSIVYFFSPAQLLSEQKNNSIDTNKNISLQSGFVNNQDGGVNKKSNEKEAGIQDVNSPKPEESNNIDLSGQHVYVFYADDKAGKALGLKRYLELYGAKVKLDEGVPDNADPTTIYYINESNLEVAHQLKKLLKDKYGSFYVQRHDWVSWWVGEGVDSIQLIVK